MPKTRTKMAVRAWAIRTVRLRVVLRTEKGRARTDSGKILRSNRSWTKTGRGGRVVTARNSGAGVRDWGLAAAGWRSGTRDWEVPASPAAAARARAGSGWEMVWSEPIEASPEK